MNTTNPTKLSIRRDVFSQWIIENSILSKALEGNNLFDCFSHVQFRSFFNRKYRSKSVRGKSPNTDGFYCVENTQRRYQNDLADAGMSLIPHIISSIWTNC